MYTLKSLIDAIDSWTNANATHKNTNLLTIDQAIAPIISIQHPADLKGHYATLLKAQQDVEDASGLHLPLGITAVMGPGSAGKSTWLKAAYDAAPDHEACDHLIMGEVGSVIPYSLTEAFEILKDPKVKVLFCDSWKDVWNDFHFTGSLSTGGINTAFTAFLGLMSQALFMLGKSLVVIMNPQTAGEHESVYQMVNSQCAGMLRMSGSNVGTFDYAQGRFLDHEVTDFAYHRGIPVHRESVFTEEIQTGCVNPISALFNQSLI
jgi:hypothetical protein